MLCETIVVQIPPHALRCYIDVVDLVHGCFYVMDTALRHAGSCGLSPLSMRLLQHRRWAVHGRS